MGMRSPVGHEYASLDWTKACSPDGGGNRPSPARENRDLTQEHPVLRQLRRGCVPPGARVPDIVRLYSEWISPASVGSDLNFSPRLPRWGGSGGSGVRRDTPALCSDSSFCPPLAHVPLLQGFWGHSGRTDLGRMSSEVS